jgi:hypothetical protein
MPRRRPNTFWVRSNYFRLAVLYLIGAFCLDASIFVLAWIWPELWFQLFHDKLPTALEVALLRRSAGQWAAFAIVQAITLACWRKHPVWLAVGAGARFSDLATDLSYLISVPNLTGWGWVAFLPPAPLNLLGFFLLMKCYGIASKTG